MFKKALHVLLGYKVKVTFPDGKTEVCRAYLSDDCRVRIRVMNNTKQCYLQSDGIVRGLWPNDKTTWQPITQK